VILSKYVYKGESFFSYKNLSKPILLVSKSAYSRLAMGGFLEST